jgi:RNA polymerase sigma-70 factor (ECF subfamily)
MDPESSFELITRAQAGDSDALNRLLERYIPRLQRWASGRLPRYARGMADTHDLVQDVLISTLKHLPRFEHRHEGSLQAYLRQAVTNRIRDELRRLEHRTRREELAEDLVDAAASPLEVAIGREAFGRYEAALAALDSTEREAAIARLELGCSYDEITLLLGKPSVEATRMAVWRTLKKLATLMSAAESR